MEMKWHPIIDGDLSGIPLHPNDCNRCAHLREWIDGFGDRWAKCELWKEPFAMAECPLR